MNSAWSIVGVNVLFGAVFGILVLWVSSFLYAWLGRLLGGSGTAREVRTVLAWSSVPHVPVLIVALLIISIGGTVVISTEQGELATPLGQSLRGLYLVVNAVFGLFACVVGIDGLSAVMGISRLRALGVFTLGFLLILAVLLTSIFLFAKLSAG